MNSEHKYILQLEKAGKIIHDIKIGLYDIGKICQAISDISIKGEDLLKRLSETQDLLEEAINEINNRKEGDIND